MLSVAGLFFWVNSRLTPTFLQYAEVQTNKIASMVISKAVSATNVLDISEVMDEVSMLLNEHGVTLIYLPAYSPELNPCELVFGKVKQTIRNREQPYHKLVLIENVCLGIASVSHNDLKMFYSNCLASHKLFADFVGIFV